MSYESKEKFHSLKLPFRKLKDFFGASYNSEGAKIPSLCDKNAVGYGSERFNLDAAVFYGKRVTPILLATAIVAAGPGLNPDFVKHLPWLVAGGIIGALTLSVLFGLEKRRYRNLPSR